MSMMKGKLPTIQEQDMHLSCENEETKCQNYLSPPSKNMLEYSGNKRKPRRTTLGLGSFKLNMDASPSGDRYIPKRRDQDCNLALYEINHNDSPPMSLNKDEFENSFEYEETKKAYNDKIEYDEMLKETFWGYNSPSKEVQDG